MKKSETIALYREAYLEGKDEIDRRSFDEKDEKRQYAAIMSWKSRRAQSNKADRPNPAVMADQLKKMAAALTTLDQLPQRDAQKLHEAASNLLYNIDNFDAIKKGQLLRQILAERERLDREIEQLRNQGIKEC